MTDIERAREWLYNGGGGNEVTEGNEKALSVTFVGLVDYLACYGDFVRAETIEEIKNIAEDCGFNDCEIDRVEFMGKLSYLNQSENESL